MAANYFSLPQYNPGREADFSGINNALENIRNQNNIDRQRADVMEQRDYQRGRDAKSDAMAKIKQGGDIANAISMMPDADPAKAKAWSQYLANYGDGNHTPEEMDFRTGPKIAAAMAGKFTDPNEAKMNALEMQYKQAQISALNRKEDDPIKALIAQKIRSAGGMPSGAPAPSVQPQSNVGGVVPQTGPMNISNPLQPPMPQPQPASGLQLVADTAAPQPAQQPAQSDMVDVPMFGKMDRQQAREFGMMLQTDPRYATLGKSITDLANGTTAEAANIGKTAQNQLDERTISAASTLGRLNEIRRQFKPEFQQIPNKLKLLGASWGAAFGGKLSPEMQKNLSDFARYRATAFDNFNQLLKELSGTAVSAQELKRQQIVQPNPGEGLFDGDDPVTFESKIDQGERIARMAIARMNYMRSKGIQFDKDTAEQFMSLQDVPAAMDRRGAEIESTLRKANPNIDPMSLQQQVDGQLKMEFGI